MTQIEANCLPSARCFGEKKVVWFERKDAMTQRGMASAKVESRTHGPDFAPRTGETSPRISQTDANFLKNDIQFV
jgi:hypothetical protein